MSLIKQHQSGFFLFLCSNIPMGKREAWVLATTGCQHTGSAGNWSERRNTGSCSKALDGLQLCPVEFSLASGNCLWKDPSPKSHMLMESRHGGYVNADELETNSSGQPRLHFLRSGVKQGHTESTAIHTSGAQVISAALGRLFMGSELSLGWSLQLSTNSTQPCLLSPRNLTLTWILNGKMRI